MANNYNRDQRKWILKQYWKFENAEHVRITWQKVFYTLLSSRKAIYHLKDKFETVGSVRNAPKSGRPKTSTTRDVIKKL